jgi:hypothetical protein
VRPPRVERADRGQAQQIVGGQAAAVPGEEAGVTGWTEKKTAATIMVKLTRINDTASPQN